MKKRTITAVKKGKFPPARAFVNTFKKECYGLLQEKEYTHEEIVTRMQKAGYGGFAACSVPGIEHYRRMLNVERALEKLPEISRLVESGAKKVPIQRMNPLPQNRAESGKKKITATKRSEK